MTTGQSPTDSQIDAGPEPGPRHGAFGPLGYAVVFGILGIVVLALLGVGAWVVQRMGSSPALPEAIQFVLPPAGGAMMSQDRVGVQTEQSWSCTLTIDGIRIPEGQYSGVRELGECYFEAGVGKMIEEFGPGRHQVSVTVFPLANPDDSQTYNWSFQTQ